jgi:protein-tyrosine phosphatase
MSDLLFTPEAIAARIVAIPGARNLRELGGYPAADGRHIRRGVIFRSGHPGNIPVESLGDLEKLGLKAMIDLRTTEEREAIPFVDTLTKGRHYWTRDYALSRGDIVAMLRDPATSAETMRQRMRASYRTFFEEQHEGIAALFALLERGLAPIMINCTAGKDRTGVVVALLMSALGVPREVIRRDYALTETMHDPADQMFHVDPDGPFAYLLAVERDVWLVMNRSGPDYIDAMFEALEARHGSVEAYLQTVHGLDPERLDRMRAMVLE